MIDSEFVIPFIEAVKELFKTMFQCDVYEGHTAGPHGSPTLLDVVAIIEISGKINGWVLLSFTNENALEMVNRLVGLDRATVDNDVLNVLGEITNIAAGHAKARFSQDQDIPLVLGLPNVIEGRCFARDYPTKSNWLEVPFSGSCGSFLLSVSVQKVQEETNKMKVLIVDDAQFMRNMLQTALSELGNMEFVQAKDGLEGFNKAVNDDFDLIFMDWNMPNLTGLEALKLIRQEGKSTPVIMVTTESEKSRVIEAVKAGATNYIIKPFNLETLSEKLRAILPTSKIAN